VTTSLDQQALIAAIASNPADDLPKLIYADWLDENGGLPCGRLRPAAADRAVADTSPLGSGPSTGNLLAGVVAGVTMQDC
jgi:uncharacterized protein (TIGR02996 family)